MRLGDSRTLPYCGTRIRTQARGFKAHCPTTKRFRIAYLTARFRTLTSMDELVAILFCVVLLLLWFQQRSRDRRKRQAACNHFHTRIVNYYTYKVEICLDCKHQEHIPDNDVDGPARN